MCCPHRLNWEFPSLSDLFAVQLRLPADPRASPSATLKLTRSPIPEPIVAPRRGGQGAAARLAAEARVQMLEVEVQALQAAEELAQADNARRTMGRWEDPERVARGLVRLAQSHRQLCADFLRDHRDGMDTPAVAKFAARIRMFDRVIASASLALSNLPDNNNDRHAMLRATIDSMAEDTTADLMPQPDPSRE